MTKEQENALVQLCNDYLEKGNEHLQFEVRMLALGFLALRVDRDHYKKRYLDLLEKQEEKTNEV